MAKPEVPESLQCLACAIRQETGLVTEPILETAMLGMVGDPAGTMPSGNVLNALEIRMTAVRSDWASWPTSNRSKFDEYLTSCVLCANKIVNWLPNKSYVYFHSAALPAYKGTYTELANSVYNITTNNVIKSVYSKVRSPGADDKWNPSDIIAVESSSVRRIENALFNFNDVYLKIVASDPRGSKLRKQNEAFRNRLDPRVTKRLHVMEEMEEIYEYNHYIDRLFRKKEMVGISLKMQSSPSVPLKVFDHKDVKGIKEALELDLVITDVKMEAQNKKAIVEFDINGVDGPFMDVRGGSSNCL